MLAEATAADGTLEGHTLVEVLDDFIMRYRCFPGGGTVIDRFLRSRENLDLAGPACAAAPA
jgi:hypothetical protein